MKRNHETRNSWRTKTKFTEEWDCDRESCFKEWIGFLDEWYGPENSSETASPRSDDDYCPAHCSNCHYLFIEGKNGSRCDTCSQIFCEACTCRASIGCFTGSGEFVCAECDPKKCLKKKKQDEELAKNKGLDRVISFDIVTTGLDPFSKSRIINLFAIAIDYDSTTFQIRHQRQFNATETRPTREDANDPQFKYLKGWWASSEDHKKTILKLQKQNGPGLDIKENLNQMITGFLEFVTKESTLGKTFNGRIHVVVTNPTFVVPFINRLIKDYTEDNEPLLPVISKNTFLQIIDLLSFKKGQQIKDNRNVSDFSLNPVHLNKLAYPKLAETKATATATDFIACLKN